MPFILWEPQFPAPDKDVPNQIFPVWASLKSLWLLTWVKLENLCCNLEFAFCCPFIPLKTMLEYFGAQVWQMELPCRTWGDFVLLDKANIWETLQGPLWSVDMCWNLWDVLKEQFKFHFQECATGCEPRVSYRCGLKDPSL